MGGSTPAQETPGTSPVPVRPTAVRWRIVALLMGYALLCHLNRISMSVAGTEQIMPQYGIDPTEMGYVYSAYLVVYTLCMTPGGWLIDRCGSWAALLIMGFGSAVFVTLTGVTGLVLSAALLFPALLVVRGLLGAVSAPIHPAAGRAVSLWFPAATRCGANGLVTGAALLGIASAYKVFGSLMDAFGWPWAFVLCGAVTAVLAIFWLVTAADRPSEHPSVNVAERQLIEPGQVHSPIIEAVSQVPLPPPLLSQPEGCELATEAASSRSLLTTRSLWLITVSYGAVNYFEYLFFYWMQYYFEQVLRLGKEDGRTYSTLLTLAMAVGIFSGGWLADRLEHRLGRRRGRALVPVAGLLTSALLLWLGLLSREVGVVVMCFALAMAAVGACEGPFWTTAVALGGRRAGTAAAICNTGGNAAGLLAPVVTPLVSDWLGLGWQAGFGLASYVCVCGAVLWWWIDPDEGSHEALPRSQRGSGTSEP
jgi:MFS family permease